MSNKVVITSDITCDLNWELEQRYGVTCIPLHIVIGGKSYEEKQAEKAARKAAKEAKQK